jgi:UDP-N-acetylmuramate dehydrogenase
LGPTGEIKWIEAWDCQFGYRQSWFKKTKDIVLEACLRLRQGNTGEVRKRMGVYWEKRQDQPKEPSCGCVFVNPKPSSAGELIDKCGLKGRKIGRAQISPKHANFIVNLGKAKASDVLKLISLAKREVKKKFGIGLKLEVQLVGFEDFL